MQIRPRLAILTLATALLTQTACAHSPEPERSERSGFGIGLTLDTEPSARSVGLPIMPGASRRIDRSGDADGSGINFSAWAGLFGFKLVVLQLASPEPADRVAEYYRRELARHGEVMDCSAGARHPGPRKAERDRDGKRLTLDCGREVRTASSGEYVFKAGKPGDFRLVNVETQGGKTHVNLVRIEARGD